MPSCRILYTLLFAFLFPLFAGTSHAADDLATQCRTAAGFDEKDNFYLPVANPKEAIDICQQAIQAHPGQPKLMAYLGRALYNADRPEESRQWIERAAKNTVVGQELMGVVYEFGFGVKADPAQAADWHRKAAEQGHAIAQSNLANSYLNGKGVKQDDAQAAEWFLKAARQGDAVAQYKLGEFYRKGKGVNEDDVEAVVWYTKAAEQGHAKAQIKLAEMYSDGYMQGGDIKRDVAESVKWMTRAADQGDAEAQYNLGWYYRDGKEPVIKKDSVKAQFWLTKAAEQGHLEAEYRLGVDLLNSNGGASDVAKGAEWLRKAAASGYGRARGFVWFESSLKAAEQGDAVAQYELGQYYRQGGVHRKNRSQAAVWYRKAGNQGHADAQCELGRLYEDGQGVNQDDTETVAWYTKAAKKGNDRGQYLLGRFYIINKHGLYNPAKGLEWLRKAAAQGHELAKSYLEFDAIRKAAEQSDAEAQFKLGQYYKFGILKPGQYYEKDGEVLVVKQDDFLAAAWYRKAAEQGNASGQFNLARLYLNGEGVKQDDAEAVKWMTMAADQNNAKAQYNLAELYLDGKHVKQDDTEAVKWLRKAAEQGHGDAQCDLGKLYEEGKRVKKDNAEAEVWYTAGAKQDSFKCLLKVKPKDDIHAVHIDVTEPGNEYLNAIGQVEKRVKISETAEYEVVGRGSGTMINKCLILTSKHVVCHKMNDIDCKNSVLNPVAFNVGKKKNPKTDQFDHKLWGKVIAAGDYKANEKMSDENETSDWAIVYIPKKFRENINQEIKPLPICSNLNSKDYMNLPVESYGYPGIMGSRFLYGDKSCSTDRPVLNGLTLNDCQVFPGISGGPIINKVEKCIVAINSGFNSEAVIINGKKFVPPQAQTFELNDFFKRGTVTDGERIQKVILNNPCD
jgi:TPR repeat protein